MKKQRVIKEGYPLPSYPYTDDPKCCPNCGTEDVWLSKPLTSGQHIGCCHKCAANYIVNPPRWTVIVADNPPDGRMADSSWFTGPMTRQFFRDQTAAEAFYQQELDLLDTGCVQLWDREERIKQVYE